MNARSSVVDHLTYVLLVVAAGFALWSAYQARSLAGELNDTRRTLATAQRNDYFPLLESASLQEPGRMLRIGAPQREQLVYFFLPDCRFCAQSAPYAERIHALTAAQGGEMFAVSLAGEASTGAYLERTGSKIPTVSVTDSRLKGLMRIRTVPALAVIEPSGKIKYIRYGVIGERDVPTGKGAARQAH